jgi:hypothetical protein
VAECIKGTAATMDLKWVIEGQANTGSFCTTQGMLYTTLLAGEMWSNFSFRNSTATRRDLYSSGYIGKPWVRTLKIWLPAQYLTHRLLRSKHFWRYGGLNTLKRRSLWLSLVLNFFSWSFTSRSDSVSTPTQAMNIMQHLYQYDIIPVFLVCHTYFW